MHRCVHGLPPSLRRSHPDCLVTVAQAALQLAERCALLCIGACVNVGALCAPYILLALSPLLRMHCSWQKTLHHCTRIHTCLHPSISIPPTHSPPCLLAPLFVPHLSSPNCLSVCSSPYLALSKHALHEQVPSYSDHSSNIVFCSWQADCLSECAGRHTMPPCLFLSPPRNVWLSCLLPRSTSVCNAPGKPGLSQYAQVASLLCPHSPKH